MRRHTTTIGIGIFLAATTAGLALSGSGVYGFALFLALPLVLGVAAVKVYKPTSARSAAGIGAIAGMIPALAPFLLGIEGAICVAMCLPLFVPLGSLGAWVEYRAATSKYAAGGAALMLLFPPAGAVLDTHTKPEVYEVSSSIEIAASPEQVWKHVAAVEALPDPTDWVFRTGIAYPTQTRLIGTGAGAARYCDLSTGPVVEVVETWDEPHLLRFRVLETPPPMREWNPWMRVEPKHLHGYFLSRFGQFRLTLLPGGRTRVEGTSWYQHGLQPAQYWRLWSDAIVRRVQVRVLSHIRELAERDARQ